MAVESDYDLEAFFNPDEFGVTATVPQLVGDGLLVNGVFDTYHAPVSPTRTSESSYTPVMLQGAEISVEESVFVCRANDVRGRITAGELIIIGQTAYRIFDIAFDQNVATLKLHNQA